MVLKRSHFSQKIISLATSGEPSTHATLCSRQALDSTHILEKCSINQLSSRGNSNTETQPTFTRLRQITGEPNLLRQAMKWEAAGVTNGVALSTTAQNKTWNTIALNCMNGHCRENENDLHCTYTCTLCMHCVLCFVHTSTLTN